MLFVIAKHRKGHCMTYRIFNTETEEYEDIKEKDIILTGLQLENAKVVKGKLKGTNGDLSRYADIDLTEAVVILEYYTIEEEISFYKIVFGNGKTFIVSITDLLEFLKQNPDIRVANSRKLIVAGELSINSIKGGLIKKELEERLDVAPTGLEKMIRQKLKNGDKEGLDKIIAKFITQITESVVYFFWERIDGKLIIKNINGVNMIHGYYSAAFINRLREKIEETSEKETEGILMMYYKVKNVKGSV